MILITPIAPLSPFVQLKGVLGKNEKGIGQIRNNFDSIALILPLSLGSLQKKMLRVKNRHLWPFGKSKFNLKSDRVNLVAPASPTMSALFTQWPGDTVQTGTGKVDPARKFKCTTAACDKVQ